MITNEQGPQYGSFSNFELLEFMTKYNSADELRAGVVNSVIEFKKHVDNMAENIRDLFREYLFPNLFAAVQVKIELCASHQVIMSAKIGDDGSDAIINIALDNMHKEMEKED